jgi:hypothetical protein
VPLEFTPVLGILVGVVTTLMLVALVIILVLRIKYKTKAGHSPDPRRYNDQDHFYCLKADLDADAGGRSTKCSSGNATHSFTN